MCFVLVPLNEWMPGEVFKSPDAKTGEFSLDSLARDVTERHGIEENIDGDGTAEALQNANGMIGGCHWSWALQITQSGWEQETARIS